MKNESKDSHRHAGSVQEEKEERVLGISLFSGNGSRGWVQRMWRNCANINFRHTRWTHPRLPLPSNGPNSFSNLSHRLSSSSLERILILFITTDTLYYRVLTGI